MDGGYGFYWGLGQWPVLTKRQGIGITLEVQNGFPWLTERGCQVPAPVCDVGDAETDVVTPPA